MPYWMNCIRCNRDGSFANVDPDCGKCSGMGQDWRDDDDTWAKEFAASNGLELHYAAEFPKFNRSGKRVYASLEEYEEDRRGPANPEPTVVEDDPPAGDVIERFVVRYLQLREQNTTLYRLNAPEEGPLTGAFDFFQLDTRFPFIDSQYLADTQSTVAALEGRVNQAADRFRPMEASELAEFMQRNPEVMGLLRAQEVVAHENFHVLQACALRAVFSLAHSFRTIDRWRNYFGMMALRTGARFKEGESIFDALRNVPDYERLLGATLHDLSRKAGQALIAARPRAEGLSVMHLIEGSAFMAQKMSVRSFAVPTFSVDGNPLYAGAWQTYQAHGGRDELAFLLACLAALRFGDIRSGFAHPVDIFLSLARDAATLEVEDAPKFPASSFGARRFGGDSAPEADTDERYFGHLNVTDARQRAALAQYRRAASAEVNRAVDLGLGISRRIARHVQVRFESTGAAVDAKQMAADYLDDFLRAYGTSIYEQFPAASTEEFCLRFLFDSEVQAVFGRCATEAAEESPVQKIGSNMLSGTEARFLSDVMQRFEALTLYDPDGTSALPYCCERHPRPGAIDTLLDCEEEASLNALVRHLCGKGLRELID